MARFFGVVGYSEGPVETDPGIWDESIVEYSYYGDVIRNSRQLESGDKVNSDLSVGNSISIVADAYARDHFHAIRYISWAGTLWDVTDVLVESPRLVLRLGGVYHGPRPTPPDEEGGTP